MANFRFLFIMFFIILMIGISACTSEKEEVDESELGYEYYPLQIGREWTYQSDSIVFTKSGTHTDTISAFIKEIITDTLRDLEGNLVHKIDRYIKRTVNEEWNRINSWFVAKDKSKVLRTEENIPLIKLVFPLKSGLRFQSNTFFNEDIKSEVGGEFISVYSGWRPKVESLNADIVYNNSLLSGLKINVVNLETIIDLRKVEEYYVKGIGLVRQEMTILDTDGNNPNNDWNVKTKKGFKHTLQLIDYK